MVLSSKWRSNLVFFLVLLGHLAATLLHVVRAFDCP